MEEFKITDSGIVFVPRYVKSELDYKFGETVSHEAFNEYINLNATQGDYNTEILNLLFTNPDQKEVPHIKYLDTILNTELTKINEDIVALQGYADAVDSVVQQSENTANLVTALITGTDKVKYAEAITDVEKAGTNKYYGTDDTGTPGFYHIANPDSLYAEPISSGAVEIEGIYYIPRVGSVEEEMLSEVVQTKLNRSSITDYNYLDNTPTLAGVALKGNITLEDINAQPVGNYLTEIPTEYVVESQLNKAIEPFITAEVASETYATVDNVNTLSNQVKSTTDVANKAAVVCIGTFTGTAKTGDLLITL